MFIVSLAAYYFKPFQVRGKFDKAHSDVTPGLAMRIA